MSTSTTSSKTATRKKLPLMHEVEIIYKGPQINDAIKIASSGDAYQVLRGAFDERKMDYKEMFYVMLLNKANYCIGISKIGEGGTSGVVVNIKEIFQLALKSNASGIILCHNHPSGNLNPSEADRSITRKVKDACDYIECNLLDHFIITSQSYISFADQGYL